MVTSHDVIRKRLTITLLFLLVCFTFSIFIQVILNNRDADANEITQQTPTQQQDYLPGNDVNLIIKIMECESGGRYNAVGDGGISIGIAQFQKATFNEFKQRANMPKAQWKNPIDQLRLMVWMLNNGYGEHWTCYRNIMAMD